MPIALYIGTSDLLYVYGQSLMAIDLKTYNIAHAGVSVGNDKVANL